MRFCAGVGLLTTETDRSRLLAAFEAVAEEDAAMRREIGDRRVPELGSTVASRQARADLTESEGRLPGAAREALMRASARMGDSVIDGSMVSATGDASVMVEGIGFQAFLRLLGSIAWDVYGEAADSRARDGGRQAARVGSSTGGRAGGDGDQISLSPACMAAAALLRLHVMPAASVAAACAALDLAEAGRGATSAAAVEHVARAANRAAETGVAPSLAMAQAVREGHGAVLAEEKGALEAAASPLEQDGPSGALVAPISTHGPWSSLPASALLGAAAGQDPHARDIHGEAARDPVGFVLADAPLDEDGRAAVQLLADSAGALETLQKHYVSARSRTSRGDRGVDTQDKRSSEPGSRAALRSVFR